jgi:hypothetical protein
MNSCRAAARGSRELHIPLRVASLDHVSAGTAVTLSSQEAYVDAQQLASEFDGQKTVVCGSEPIDSSPVFPLDGSTGRLPWQL